MLNALSQPPASESLEDAVVVLTREVQQSFARLISQLPGRMSRAAHLQKYLEIDSKIAWQFFKIAKADDPMEAVRYMPSMVSLRRVVSAAKRKGVSQDILDAIQAAVSEYDAAGKQHADGRASFTSMIASLRNDQASAAVTLQTRRSSFRDNSLLWGAQAGVFFTQACISRDSNGEIDSTITSSKTDFRKLRVGALPILYGASQRNKEGELKTVLRDPVDPEAFEKYGVPLLPQFCSKPIPSFGNAEIMNGWTIHKIHGDQIGKLGAIDLVTSYINRDRGFLELSDGRKVLSISMAFRVPTETAILELLVDRTKVTPVTPKLSVFPEVGVDFVTELERQQPVIPHFESVQSLGRFTTAPPVSDVRNYAEITSYVMQTQHWAKENFDVYRVSISYPVLHTLAVLWFEVPEARPA